jgi:hypothetical protein
MSDDDIHRIDMCYTCGAPALSYPDGHLEYITVDEFDGELDRLRAAISAATAAWLTWANRLGNGPRWDDLFAAMRGLVAEEQRWTTCAYPPLADTGGTGRTGKK